MARVLVTTVPFGAINKLPLELLHNAGIEVVINPLGRKLKNHELAEMVSGFDALIAGTEVIDSQVIDAGEDLKLIARVGIGLDGVDLNYARSRGIAVSYTPDAPAPAVAELTVGLMISGLRHVVLSDTEIRNGVWERRYGKRLADSTIGIIGCGRIGSRVIRRLVPFGSPRVLVNDVKPIQPPTSALKIELVDKQSIYREADVISLHVPLTRDTRDMIGEKELVEMRSNCFLINTARGGIINERALAVGLREKVIGGAAIDVFEREPYVGELSSLDNVILTPHLGSMSADCRVKMEVEATESVVQFLRDGLLTRSVPEYEYLIQSVCP